jgi:RNAse (barnase) inhibitor barstar
MSTLTEILDDPARNGVYHIDSAVPDMPGLIRLDAREMADETDLLAALGHALDFPAYYGVNWDALEECLSDLSWHPGPVIVLLGHADALAPDTLHTLVDIWREAAAAWAEAGRVCVLLLEGVDLPGLAAVA